MERQDVDNIMQITKSIITLQQLRIYAYHGVDPQERLVGAHFYLDLQADVNFRDAILTDDLSNTVSYADIVKVITNEMAIPSRLLEHVGGRIANSLFEKFPLINKITLSLCKENPPMGVDCPQAGITIEAVR